MITITETDVDQIRPDLLHEVRAAHARRRRRVARDRLGWLLVGLALGLALGLSARCTVPRPVPAEVAR